MAAVSIHPSERARLAHNTRTMVMGELDYLLRGQFTSEDVAGVLGDAFGEALAICVLNGAGQAEVDEINDRSVVIYKMRVLGQKKD